MNRERFAPIASLVLAAAIVVGGTAALVVSLVRSRSSEPSQVRPPPSASWTHSNEVEGFAFRYPRGWIAFDVGRTSTVQNPDSSLVITFGPGSATDLQVESTAFLASLRREYRDVEVLARQNTIIQGSPALMASGTGTNRAGVQIRFLAIAVTGTQRSYDIAVFTDADADPTAVQPPAQEIVGSFRPPPELAAA
jgi:hypothetical protein